MKLTIGMTIKTAKGEKWTITGADFLLAPVGEPLALMTLENEEGKTSEMTLADLQREYQADNLLPA